MKQDQTSIKKSLPYHFLAEQVILNCLILNSETIKLSIKLLPVEAFYFKNHQQIYKILIFILRLMKISFLKSINIDIMCFLQFLALNICSVSFSSRSSVL